MSQLPLLDDRRRLGTMLTVIGAVGLAGALVVGIAGWILAGLAVQTVTDTIEPIDAIVTNVADLVEASQVVVERTTDAIESIEAATRSTAQTLESVGTVLSETSDLVEGDLADGLDSAVETLPALIDTASVIDNTMRALRIVGVEYDPDVPLDQSLTSLQRSLQPIPDQLRSQSASLDEVETGLEQISSDAGALAAVLLEARIDMMEAEQLLVDAAGSVDLAAGNIASIQEDLPTYQTLARVVVVAAMTALIAAASAPLVIGMRYRREDAS